MKKLIFLITIIILVSIPISGNGDEKEEYLPTLAEAKITNAKVDVDITVDSRGIYKYIYSVTNLTNTKGELDGVSIDLSIPQDGELISSTSLTNGPGTLIGKHATPAEGNVVPVAFWQPNGWIGQYEIPSEEFISALGHIGEAYWFPKNNGLVTEEQVRGLTLYSYGLPGIRKFTLNPFFIPVQGRDFPSNWSPGQFQHWIMTDGQAINFTGMTIGPYAPPANFVPVDFLNYIISLKQQAYQLGWIVQKKEDEHDKDKSKDKQKKDKGDTDKETGIMQSLDTKLNHSMTELQAGHTKQAVNILFAFVGEVEGLYNACGEHEEHDGDRDGHDKNRKDKGKDHDPEIASQKLLANPTPPPLGKGRIEEGSLRGVETTKQSPDKKYEHCNESHLTSEAYALLKYNTEYLINRLGGNSKGHEKEDHGHSKDKDKHKG